MLNSALFLMSKSYERSKSLLIRVIPYNHSIKYYTTTQNNKGGLWYYNNLWKILLKDKSHYKTIWISDQGHEKIKEPYLFMKYMKYTSIRQ